MVWRITDPEIGTQPIATTDTTQNHPLGKIVRASDGTNDGEFIYLKGVTSTVVGSWVTYNLDDGGTTLTVADAIGPVAVAMSINDATTDFGWYQISGKASAKALTGFLDNGNVYLTSTAGSIDDTDVAGDYVSNAKGASAVNETTFLADFEIERPFVRDGLDN